MERAGFVGFALVIGLFLVGFTNDIDRLPTAASVSGSVPPWGRDAPIGAATIAEAFRLTVEDNPDRIAVRTKDDEIAYTSIRIVDPVEMERRRAAGGAIGSPRDATAEQAVGGPGTVRCRAARSLVEAPVGDRRRVERRDARRPARDREHGEDEREDGAAEATRHRRPPLESDSST